MTITSHNTVKKYVGAYQARSILLDIIEDKHQKRSTIITSQIPIKDRHEIIGEKEYIEYYNSRIKFKSKRMSPVQLRAHYYSTT